MKDRGFRVAASLTTAVPWITVMLIWLVYNIPKKVTYFRTEDQSEVAMGPGSCFVLSLSSILCFSLIRNSYSTKSAISVGPTMYRGNAIFI